MQINRGLTSGAGSTLSPQGSKYAEHCDSMWGQTSGGLQLEPVHGSTILRHSGLSADLPLSISVGAGAATRLLLTPVPPGERVWVRDQILRRMVQVKDAAPGNKNQRSEKNARQGTMYTYTVMIIGALEMLRWMVSEATCAVSLWMRRSQMWNVANKD